MLIISKAFASKWHVALSGLLLLPPPHTTAAVRI